MRSLLAGLACAGSVVLCSFSSGSRFAGGEGEEIAFGPAVFTRSKGKPTEEFAAFTLPVDAAGHLRIRNGVDGSKKVASAVISVNGRVVVRPNAFRPGKVVSIERALDLPAGRNVLGVKLASAPGAKIAVTVTVPQRAPKLDAFVAMTRDPTVAISGLAVRCGTQVSVFGGTETVSTTSDDQRRFSVDVPLHRNRLNHLSVVEDLGGGARTPAVRAEVTQDSQPPELFIDFPPAGSELTDATTSVAGRVGDRLSGFMGLEVTVNGKPAIVNEGIGTNGTFEAQDIPLALNVTTTIRATAKDELGNVASREITVERVPLTGAKMTIASGNGQSGPILSVLPEPLVVRVERLNGQPFASKVVTFEVIRSDGRLAGERDGGGALRLQTLTDAQGLARGFWRLGTDAGCGNNRIRVTSRDINGSIFFCASADPLDPRQINVGSGNNQRGEAGAPAPEHLRVWVSDGCNGVGGVPVTFTVTSGDAVLEDPGGARPPSTTVTATTVRTGHAEVGVVPGVGNSTVAATFSGNRSEPAVFTVFGVARDPETATGFAGIVLDNGHRPIGGATCRLTVAGVTLPAVTTAADGTFRFDDIGESGPAALRVDGLTATSVDGRGIPKGSFPALAFEPDLVANAENRLATPILLPRLDPANAKVYDGTEDVELTVAGVAGLKMLIRAGSMRRADGSVPSPSDPAVVALNQVHFDDVPMPMPDGAAPPFAWTLQPAGATFDPPVQVTYPNMSGLPPGAIAYFLSFDHATNRFEIVATASVTPDGSCVVSDPGAGIRVAGWGCNCPPYSVTGECENCDELQTPCASANVSGEIGFATNLLKSALSKIPFVSDPSVSGSLSGEVCPICCEGEELFPGTITFSGSLTAQATVSKVLSPIDFGPFSAKFSFLGDEYEVKATLELGPKVEATPSLTIAGSGSRNFCTEKNCFTLSGCGNVTATLSATAEASVEALKNGKDFAMIGVKATASATTNAAAEVEHKGSGCPGAGTTVTGCLGDFTGKVVVEAFGFDIFTSPTVTLISFDPDCGCD